jgi:ribosomal-protein-alanine N-acetyltransferase
LKGAHDVKREEIYRIFSEIPELRTRRLTLRRMRVGDSFDMFEYAGREDVTEYLLWKPHPDVAYTREYLQFVATHYEMGDFFDWAIVWREQDKMIGTCGFTRFDYTHNVGEIGYVINPLYRGMEIADEAVREVMRFGFEVLKLNRIEAKFMEDNVASRRVMEKTGMTFEGFHRKAMKIKGKYETIGICSILREEFYKN